MTVKEMIERQRQITDAAKAEGRSLTDEERREFDDLQEKIDQELRSENGLEGQKEGQQESREAILQAERARVSEIEDLCRSFSIDPQEYIRGGQNIDEVRAAVIKKLQDTHSPVGVRVLKDAEDKRREAVADGILMRENITVENPAAGASGPSGRLY